MTLQQHQQQKPSGPALPPTTPPPNPVATGIKLAPKPLLVHAHCTFGIILHIVK